MSGQMAVVFWFFFFAHQAEHFWSSRRWGHVDGLRVNPNIASCRGFCFVPGPLQSVQRAEMWAVILALQTQVPFTLV